MTIASAVWLHRAGAELEAAARFARLATELDALSARAPLSDLAMAASQDEQRHARLCADLAIRFGGAAPDLSPRVAARVGPSGLDARQRLLYEVVAMCCITESLSAALLIEMEKSANDAAVERTVHEILRDEVGHSRLGWAHLAAEHETGATAFLGVCLPAMLAETVSDELFWPDEVADSNALPELGALTRRTRREIFEGSMHEIVFPGLARFGVDVAPARRWLETMCRRG